MKKPNIVFILTDQQRADTIHALGAAHMKTPAMDSLVDGGVTFNKAFCPGATCTPSRAAIFTGMYAHNTGTYSFNNWGHQRTWVQDLADGGYWCASIGKMHFQPRDVSGGYHERVIVENPTSVTPWGGHGDDDWGKFLAYHGMERPNYRHRSDPDWLSKWQGVPWEWDEKLHSDVFVADSAVGWISQRKEEDPFFLQVGFPGPHEPWDAPEEYVKLYEGVELPKPFDFPNSLEEQPPQHKSVRAFHAQADHEARIDMPNAKLENVMRMRKHYYAKISYVDAQIQKVLDALERSGHLENTIVLFSSDHGEMLGDHGAAYKWLMNDSITRVPFIVKDFRKGKGAATEVADLVSLMDVGPTVMDLAGLVKPTRLEGQSLTGYLEGGEVSPRKAVYCEDNYMVMMRSETEKIVHYIGAPYGEYYRLEVDPQEVRNLWDDDEHVSRRKELQLELLDWLAKSSYFNYGHKTSTDGGGAYGVRWHGNDPCLHGENYREKPKGAVF